MTHLPVLQNRIEIPECFGLHWDPNAAECRGGVDHNFTNKTTGSHVRDKCFYFQSCGAKVQTERSAQQAAQAQTHSQAMVRPSAFQQMVSAAAARQQQVAPMSQQMQQVQVSPQMQQMHPQMAMQQQQGPWYPAPTYQLSYGIPQYLSVPEHRMPGETVWGVLLREVLRGVFKSMGHTASSFFDRTSFRQAPPGEP